MSVSTDHIELLTTAASSWRVIVPKPVAALSAGSGLFPLSPQQTADLLLAQRTLATGVAGPTPYQFQPVTAHIEPVQIIKAVHAFEHMCEHLPAWPTAPVRKLLESLGRAAAERLPGYSDAAWDWTRRCSPAGPPVGVGAEWRPDIEGLVWHDIGVSQSTWLDARLVVVTAEALPLLRMMPKRASVFVLGQCPGGELPDLWSGEVEVSQLLWWPECEPWLTEQLASDLDPQ